MMDLELHKNKKHIPLRMCVVCRIRSPKISLLKFKKNFSTENIGRSFYICKDCIKKDEKKLYRALRGLINLQTQELKEKLANGQI